MAQETPASSRKRILMAGLHWQRDGMVGLCRVRHYGGPDRTHWAVADPRDDRIGRAVTLLTAMFLVQGTGFEQ